MKIFKTKRSMSDQARKLEMQRGLEQRQKKINNEEVVYKEVKPEKTKKDAGNTKESK